MFTKKKRFTLILLGKILLNTSHINFIIYDNIKNIFERFESYGAIDNDNEKDLDKFLKKNLTNLVESSKYISPSEYINKFGFQNISENLVIDEKLSDPGGFCMAWCFWYLEMRLLNEDLNNVKLINKSIKNIIKTKKSFTNYIRDYANKLAYSIKDVLSNNKLFNQIIYDKNIDHKKSKIIYEKYIIKELDKILLFN